MIICSNDIAGQLQVGPAVKLIGFDSSRLVTLEDIWLKGILYDGLATEDVASVYWLQCYVFCTNSLI